MNRQNGQLFQGQEFENLRKSYSIWIYMAPTKKMKNGMNLTCFDTWRVHGRVREREYTLNNIISIYLDDPENVKKGDIIYFLSVLLRSNDSSEVTQMLEEYGIPTESFDRKELDEMCDFSVGMFNIGAEEGMRKGEQKGRREGNYEKALNKARALMNEKHWSLEEALALMTDTPEERAWVEAQLKVAN